MEDMLADSVLQMVKSSNGIKASQIAKHLKVSRKEINKILYGKLANCCFRDEKYLWYCLGDAISIPKLSEDYFGKLEKKLTIKANKFSHEAISKIEKSGSKYEVM